MWGIEIVHFDVSYFFRVLVRYDAKINEKQTPLHVSLDNYRGKRALLH